MSDSFAEVILPIPVRERFTYRIPEGTDRQVIPFMRVIVPLGKNKQTAALVTAILPGHPDGMKVKEIIAVPDEYPVIHPLNFDLWQWISRYYVCPEGDVLKAAVPAGRQQEKAGMKFQPVVCLHPGIDTPEKWTEVLGKVNRAVKQKSLLIYFAQKIKLFSPDQTPGILKSELLKGGGYNLATLHQLTEKKILQVCHIPITENKIKGGEEASYFDLLPPHQEAYDQIILNFRDKKVVLLHGINGSGKTQVYQKCIRDFLQTGKQVLFLVPETSNIPKTGDLLFRSFGERCLLYHSGMNDTERAETWNHVYHFKESESNDCQIIIGTRSSIFLPFSRLGLIIADDEHDGSYKQSEPSPRYHARDMAVLLGSQHQCAVLLGSATPSFESLHNATSGKYGLVHLQKRLTENKMPELIIADLTAARKKRQMQTVLTPALFVALEETLKAGEQAILIQTRRGYATFLQCNDCGFVPVCPDCNVNLTAHLSRKLLICHYCGYKIIIPEGCPSCGSSQMKNRGLGTEKAESEIAGLFPSAMVSRLDGDTASTLRSRSRIIQKMDNKETDVLIGTQMAVKGMDSGHIRLAGILNADLILNGHDFRSWEKSYQLFQQIMGRLIRTGKQAMLIIQSTNPDLPVFRYLQNQDYMGFYLAASEERKLFLYPPILQVNQNLAETHE